MILVFTKPHFKSSCIFLLLMGVSVWGLASSKSVVFAAENVAAQSKTEKLPDFAFGTYQRAQDIKLKRKNDVVVERFIDGLSFFVRPFAAPRLRTEAASFHQIEFKQKGPLIGIKADKFPSFAWTKLNGQYHEFNNTPRGDFKLRRWVENGHLLSEAKKKDAVRLSLYRFFTDGTLRVDITVRSEYLPNPLNLSYLYKKVL